jgi:hypothetical protein
MKFVISAFALIKVECGAIMISAEVSIISNCETPVLTVRTHINILVPHARRYRIHIATILDASFHTVPSTPLYIRIAYHDTTSGQR